MFAEIGQKNKLFNIQEAKTLLPMVRAVTVSHRDELAPIQERLGKMLANDPRRRVYEKDYEAVVSSWRNKVELLGAFSERVKLQDYISETDPDWAR